MTKTKTKPEKKPPLTDVERHARFVETAREVDADDDPKSFDRAFASINIVDPPKPKG